MHINDFKAFKFIKNIKSRYTFGKQIGQGQYGTVKKCTHNDCGSEFAIKIISKELIKADEVNQELLENELSVLSNNSHPNIIRIVDLLEDNSNYYVVSELVRGGELFVRLSQTRIFEADACDIVY